MKEKIPIYALMSLTEFQTLLVYMAFFTLGAAEWTRKTVGFEHLKTKTLLPWCSTCPFLLWSPHTRERRLSLTFRGSSDHIRTVDIHCRSNKPAPCLRHECALHVSVDHILTVLAKSSCTRVVNQLAFLKPRSRLRCRKATIVESNYIL